MPSRARSASAAAVPSASDLEARLPAAPGAGRSAPRHVSDPGARSPAHDRLVLARFVLTALGYAALVAVGRLTVLPEFGVALFYPAAGLAVVWILLSPTWLTWWVPVAVALGSLAVGLAVAAPLLPTLLFALAHAVAAAVTGFLARGVPAPTPRPVFRLSSQTGFLRLLVAVGTGALLGAPIAGLAAALDAGRWQPLAPLTWSVRNASSAILLATVVLVALSAPRLRPRLDDRPWPGFPTCRRASLELALLLGFTVVSCYLVFLSSVGMPSAFLLVVASAWGGYRFGTLVAGYFSLTLILLTLVTSVGGRGPFAEVGNPVQQALLVQAFCLMCVVLSVLLALGSTEQRRLTEALEASARRSQERLQLFEALTASTPDAVAVIDSDDAVVWSNRPARRLLPGAGSAAGWRLADLDGQPLAPHQLPHRRALAGEVVTHERLVAGPGGAEGERVVLSVSAAGLGGFENHHHATAVLLMRDVTADDAARRELQSFAGVVAHDLRGPLASVAGWTEAALDDLEDPATVRRALERIAGRAAQMGELIEDLLVHAQANAGSLQVVTLDTEAMLRELAEIHGAPLTVRGPLPTLRGDRAQLRQVFANLLANAVKYVVPGEDPHVEVSGTQDAATTTISVHDRGVGIPPDQLALIWAPFHRAHADYPGTGLGLAICRTIVERHDGRVEAAPRPGGGTTFAVTLPR
ncbi:ATP-binding protein [Nocardioides nanhaiensis]|uniref:Sensor-like histidine kinase SenX3 n=1 Tax=Nocardioides nanhaiensis TaxID=1476871 RepID=A0ABP8W1V1_9ACTN